MRQLLLALSLAACAQSGGDPLAGNPAPADDTCAPLDFSGPAPGAPPLQPTTGCDRTSIGFTPLTELLGSYQGVEGGLYCNGSNDPPAAHLAQGLALARAIAPRDATGDPDPQGRYVLVSIGMSNTTQEFSAFLQLLQGETDLDPALAVVDGAQGGRAADDWADPASDAWTTLGSRLASRGVTTAQVAAAWVKLASRGPTEPFPGDAAVLANDIAATLRNLKDRCPNLAIAYLSSRIYAGYATTTLNPEPFAYQSAFAVKKVILDQIAGLPELNHDPAKGAVRAPWLAWGPYLWADGTRPRADGLTWECTDLQADGTHPSTSGRAKVADLLLDFLRSDVTAREWFLAAP